MPTVRTRSRIASTSVVSFELATIVIAYLTRLVRPPPCFASPCSHPHVASFPRALSPLLPAAKRMDPEHLGRHKHFGTCGAFVSSGDSLLTQSIRGELGFHVRLVIAVKNMTDEPAIEVARSE